MGFTVGCCFSELLLCQTSTNTGILKADIRKVKDTKGAIRSRKPKKNIQCNGQKEKNKRTNDDLQNTTQKTIDLIFNAQHNWFSS